MFKLYTLNIANNKSCYTKNAYKIFFIILELIRNYQLSSLLIILFKKRIIPRMVRFFMVCIFTSVRKTGFCPVPEGTG